jgi:hypothetical protein
MAFALPKQARLLLVPPCRVDRHYDAAGFASCCGRHFLHPAPTPASRPTPGVSLPRTLASPRPDSHRQADVARLRHEVVPFLTAPELLDAHQHFLESERR